MTDEAAEQATPQPEEKETGAQPLPPLGVSGVVVTKAQLMEALRVYVPGITDVSLLADGEHFSILFSPDSQPRQR